MTAPERPWLTEGARVARIQGRGAGTETAVLVKVVRQTATQVVVEDPSSHEEERFRVSDLTKIGWKDAWRPAPRLDDPEGERCRSIASRVARERARADVWRSYEALKKAADQAVDVEEAAVLDLRNTLDDLADLLRRQRIQGQAR